MSETTPSPQPTAQPVQPVTETDGSDVIAAMPVYSQGHAQGRWVGTVLLSRSTQPLEHEILALWAILGSVAVAAMIGAAVMGFGLARWVSRPLKTLDAAARRLADGDLAIRAKVTSGPPELRRMARDRVVVSVKRKASPSPATGSAKAHDLEEKALIDVAFGAKA